MGIRRVIKRQPKSAVIPAEAKAIEEEVLEEEPKEVPTKIDPTTLAENWTYERQWRKDK